MEIGASNRETTAAVATTEIPLVTKTVDMDIPRYDAADENDDIPAHDVADHGAYNNDDDNDDDDDDDNYSLVHRIPPPIGRQPPLDITLTDIESETHMEIEMPDTNIVTSSSPTTTIQNVLSEIQESGEIRMDETKLVET